MESSALNSALPLILVEVVLVFGGVLAFGWWQLRSVKRDRAQMLAERAQRASADAASAQAAGGTAASSAAPDGASGATSPATSPATAPATPAAPPVTTPIDAGGPPSTSRSPTP